MQECEANECDPLLCLAALEDEVFPIADSPSNYCYCENFCPIYGSCPEGTTLDEKLLICLGPEVSTILSYFTLNYLILIL